VAAVAAFVVGVATAAATAGHAASAAIAARQMGTAGLVRGVVDVKTNLAYADATGAGTGIVVSANGEVLTNNHVIEGATSVTVTDLDNGHIYRAIVVGYDRSADIAVLRVVHAGTLTTARLGDSRQVRIGDAVAAIGNAGGVGGTPSTAPGTVRAFNRSLVAADAWSASFEHLSGMIETSAALQPGDSGGPLINSRDQVIGIDTAGGSQGFVFQPQLADRGFSIPIDRATAIARQIKAGRSSSTIHVGPTPFLGVDFAQLNASHPGLLVVAVDTGKPAAKAGLAPYDIITGLDGHAVATDDEFTRLLLGHKPGETIRLDWVNRTGRHTSAVRLASGPPQ
jgi:S1-C subfamily serine protease